MPQVPVPAPDVAHEKDLRALINEEGDRQYADRGTAVIADPTAPGATYDQAVAASTRTSVVAILAALRASGVIV